MFISKIRLQKLTLALVFCLLPGCGILKHKREYESDIDKYMGFAESIRYSDVIQDVDGVTIDHSNEGTPATVDSKPRQTYLLSIEEAVQNALTNSRILRDLGARLIRAPDTARSVMDPAIVETDPTTGVEAALSQFDASVASSLFFENNDFAANNLFQLQGSDTFKQDFLVYQLELSKRAATGTEFALRNNIDYDANNSPANLFPSAWNTNIEAEVRHPLLQGSGVAFNRVAGPNGTPKNFNGVVLARLDTDVSQVDFEIAIRDLINNVENAYWDLYFAYRHLDSRINARNAAFETLQTIEAKKDSLDSNDVLLELANEQYWEFEEEVINAQSGRIVDGTRSNNGSQGGSFNTSVGLQVAERRLRLLMGWPINDDREIRPQRDPSIVEVSFDWSNAMQEAQTGRAEIRKQQLKLKRRGMELAATRNFLLQRVDFVGLYRFRGFGQRLIRSNPEFDRFDNAYRDLMSGDFQEWRVGLETAFPVGFRQAHSAVRSAQLKYSREQAILDELTRDVIHNLSNEYANVRRAFKTLQINYNRKHAANSRVEILKGKADADLPVNFRELLTAQRRAADADSKFFRSLVEYVLAIKNMHFEKGSLLQYNNIYLAEHSPSELFEKNQQRIFESTTLPTDQLSTAPLSESTFSSPMQQVEPLNKTSTDQLPVLESPNIPAPSDQGPIDRRPVNQPINQRPIDGRPMDQGFVNPGSIDQSRINQRSIYRRRNQSRSNQSRSNQSRSNQSRSNQSGLNQSGAIKQAAQQSSVSQSGINQRTFYQSPTKQSRVDRIPVDQKPLEQRPAVQSSFNSTLSRKKPRIAPFPTTRKSEGATNRNAALFGPPVDYRGKQPSDLGDRPPRTGSPQTELLPTTFDKQRPGPRAKKIEPPSAFDNVDSINISLN